MRFATYNVEWFNTLFDDDGQVLDDDRWSGRRDVTRTQQLQALGHVFTALDADAVMVIEAPDQNGKRDTVRSLENFAARFDLRTRRVAMGFANTTQQEIALLYDPDALTAVHDPMPGTVSAPQFDEVFNIDLDIDATEDQVRFSKPPLELSLHTASGFAFRMIGAHLKSKAPHGARGRDEVMRVSIANRRKQLAQSTWLRRRVEHHLTDRTPLMVLGDLNDGPGLDEYEALFGRSSVEIVMGQAGEAVLFDPHAAQVLRHRWSQLSTARFHRKEEGRYLQALLDYVFLSEDLCHRRPRWRIWHPFDDAGCFEQQDLRDALLTASDHFPVSVDIDL